MDKKSFYFEGSGQYIDLDDCELIVECARCKCREKDVTYTYNPDDGWLCAACELAKVESDLFDWQAKYYNTDTSGHQGMAQIHFNRPKPVKKRKRTFKKVGRFIDKEYKRKWRGK